MVPDVVGAMDGQQLECSQDDELDGQEFMDGGQGVVRLLRAGRYGRNGRGFYRVAGDRGEILGPKEVGKAAEDIFKNSEQGFDRNARGV